MSPPRRAALAALGLALSFASPARAQSASELATRAELVRMASAARAGQRHQAALDFALRAEQIVSSPSALRFIADEHLALGQLAQAYETLLRCARSTDRDANEAQRRRVVGECAASAAELRPRLAVLTVRVREPAPAGLEVRVEGRLLPPSQIGNTLLVSPGTLTIEATARGHVTMRESLRVEVGELRELRVELPLEAASAPAAAATSSEGPREAVVPSRGASAHTEAAGTGGLARGLSFTAIALGGAGLVTAAVLVPLREAEAVAYNDEYLRGTCNGANVLTDSDACRARVTRGEAMSAASIGLLAGGGTLLAAGVLGLVLTRAPAESASPRARVACSPAVRGAVCAVQF